MGSFAPHHGVNELIGDVADAAGQRCSFPEAAVVEEELLQHIIEQVGFALRVCACEPQLHLHLLAVFPSAQSCSLCEAGGSESVQEDA